MNKDHSILWLRPDSTCITSCDAEKVTQSISWKPLGPNQSPSSKRRDLARENVPFWVVRVEAKAEQILDQDHPDFLLVVCLSPDSMPHLTPGLKALCLLSDNTGSLAFLVVYSIFLSKVNKRKKIWELRVVCNSFWLMSLHLMPSVATSPL